MDKVEMRKVKEKSSPISVILPVYNEEDNVVGAIESVLKQDYEKVEIIVINDGSNDSTRKVLGDEYGNEEKVRIFDQENKGFSCSLNKGLNVSRYDFIARIDADDRCLPGRLKKQASFLERNEDVGVVGSSYVRVDGIRQEEYIREYPTRDEVIRKEMAKYIPLSHSCAMYRKRAVVDAGGYDEELTDHEDLDLWIRVAQNWKLANVPEPLVVRHIRSDSYWHRNFSQHARNVHLAKLNAKAVSELSLPVYYYAFPIARLAYSWLPDAVKRVTRRLLSNIEEQDLEGRPQIPSS